MKLKLHSPHQIFLWTALFTAILWILLKGFEMDIQLFTTYIVIVDMPLIFSILLSILGGIYFFIRNKRLGRWLTKGHTILTILSMGISLCMLVLMNDNLERENISFTKINQVNITAIIMFILAQVLFFINIGVGLIKGKKIQ